MNSASTNVRAHGRVRGRVQGVSYRANTSAQARALGLVGWVRNLSDGSVEFVAEGSRARVQALIDWCHRGPRMARVDAVEVQWGPAEGDLTGFKIRR